MSNQGYHRVDEQAPSVPSGVPGSLPPESQFQSSGITATSSGSRTLPSGTSAPSSAATSTGDLESATSQAALPKRLKKAAPFFVRACHAFCYVFFPFISCVVMVVIGLRNSVNQCPRNLDGILLWFGLIGFAFNVTIYVDKMAGDADELQELLSRARIALVVLLAALTVVGMSWAHPRGGGTRSSLRRIPGALEPGGVDRHTSGVLWLRHLLCGYALSKAPAARAVHT